MSKTNSKTLSQKYVEIAIKGLQEKKAENIICIDLKGFGNAEWILLDYVNVVIHIFLEDARTFYNLEGLWGDAKITKVKRA